MVVVLECNFSVQTFVFTNLNNTHSECDNDHPSSTISTILYHPHALEMVKIVRKYWKGFDCLSSA